MTAPESGQLYSVRVLPRSAVQAVVVPAVTLDDVEQLTNESIDGR